MLYLVESLLKIKLLITAISAAILLVPKVALADWVHIGEDVEGKNLYLENTTIQRKKNDIFS